MAPRRTARLDSGTGTGRTTPDRESVDEEPTPQPEEQTGPQPERRTGPPRADPSPQPEPEPDPGPPTRRPATDAGPQPDAGRAAEPRADPSPQRSARTTTPTREAATAGAPAVPREIDPTADAGPPERRGVEFDDPAVAQTVEDHRQQVARQADVDPRAIFVDEQPDGSIGFEIAPHVQRDRVADELETHREQAAREFGVEPHDIETRMVDGEVVLEPSIDAQQELIEEDLRQEHPGADVDVRFDEDAGEFQYSVDEERETWIGRRAEGASDIWQSGAETIASGVERVAPGVDAGALVFAGPTSDIETGVGIDEVLGGGTESAVGIVDPAGAALGAWDLTEAGVGEAREIARSGDPIRDPELGLPTTTPIASGAVQERGPVWEQQVYETGMGAVGQIGDDPVLGTASAVGGTMGAVFGPTAAVRGTRALGRGARDFDPPSIELGPGERAQLGPGRSPGQTLRQVQRQEQRQRPSPQQIGGDEIAPGPATGEQLYRRRILEQQQAEGPLGPFDGPGTVPTTADTTTGGLSMLEQAATPGVVAGQTPLQWQQPTISLNDQPGLLTDEVEQAQLPSWATAQDMQPFVPVAMEETVQAEAEGELDQAAILEGTVLAQDQGQIQRPGAAVQTRQATRARPAMRQMQAQLMGQPTMQAQRTVPRAGRPPRRFPLPSLDRDPDDRDDEDLPPGWGEGRFFNPFAQPGEILTGPAVSPMDGVFSGGRGDG